MESAFDIPDPTDWLDTPLKDFSSLENALHCDICKEFYDTPMITSCSHTFCSKCIRTCLSANGKCPSCQAADQASKLRNNWILQTVVEQFLAARPAALDLARREREVVEQAKKPEKRKRIVLGSDDIAQTEQDGRNTRRKSRRIAASQGSEPEVIEVADSDEDFVPEREPDDGLMDCLFACGKRVKAEGMSAHLDRCEEEKRQAREDSQRRPVQTRGTRPAALQDRKVPDRISELNSSLLNDAKLRSKLRDAGIPNWGVRQLMIKRHTEWVNLWNANCDSGGKKMQRELLKDLDAWERTQGGRAPNSNGLSSTIMKKDFDGAGWANSNKSDFSRLIADAKRQKTNPALDKAAAKDVDMVNGNHDAGGESNIDVQITISTHDSSQQALFSSESIDRPYENNPEALSSIRSKVEAANEGRHIEPMINANFKGLPTTDLPEPTADVSQQNPNSSPAGLHPAEMLEKTRSHSRDEHAANSTTGSPCDLGVHITSSPVKKVPMFEVPQQPISDIDGGRG